MKKWISYLILLAIGFAGLITALYIYRGNQQNDLSKEQLIFNAKTNSFVEIFKEYFLQYNYVLNGLSSFFSASQLVDTQEWSYYCNSLNLKEYMPCLRLLSFVANVSDSTKEVFLNQTKAQGILNFKLWPASNQTEYLPIVLTFPDYSNDLTGYDLGLEKNLQETALLSAQKNQLLFGPELNLNRARHNPATRTLWFPCRKLVKDSTTGGDVFGWAVAFLDFDISVNRAAKSNQFININLELFEKDSSNQEKLVVSRSPNPDPNPLFTNERFVEFGGKTWVFRFSSGPAYKLSLNNFFSSLLFVCVLLTTLLATCLVYIYFRHHEIISSQLNLSQQKNNEPSQLLESILNSANYSIISTDLNGKIINFNKAAEKLLGYSQEEVINIKTPELFHDKEEMKARAKELSDLLGKTILPGFEVFISLVSKGIPDQRVWTYIRKDQTRVSVLLSISTITDSTGKVIGYMGIAKPTEQLK